MWDNELLTNELIRTQVQVQELREYIGECGGQLTPLNGHSNLSSQVIATDGMIYNLSNQVKDLEREVFVLKKLGGTENI